MMAASLSYWQLAFRELWRLRAGKVGLIGAGLLLLVAVAAPLLASSLPILRDDGGRVWSPLIVSLLDSRIYPGAADRFFNCLLLSGMAFVLSLPVLGFVRAVLVPHLRGFWSALAAFFVAAAVTLFLLSLLPFFALSWSQPLDYYEPPARGEATAHAPEQTAAEEAARLHVATLVPHDPHEVAPQRGGLAPMSHDPHTSALAPLGTTAYGADATAVWIHGARSALSVALLAAALACALGLLLGLTAASMGGPLDALLTWLADVLRTMPALLLGLGVLALAPLTPRTATTWLIVTAGVLLWGPIFRHVRREVRRETAREYVVASRALGSSRLRVVFVHLAPAALGPTLSGGCFALAGALTLKASLAFLQVMPATSPPTASWGRMLREAAQAGHAAPAVLAGLAIVATILIANLLGEALHKVSRPQAKPVIG